MTPRRKNHGGARAPKQGPNTNSAGHASLKRPGNWQLWAVDRGGESFDDPCNLTLVHPVSGRVLKLQQDAVIRSLMDSGMLPGIEAKPRSVQD